MNHKIKLNPKERRETTALLLSRYHSGYEDDLPHSRMVAFDIDRIYCGDQKLLRALESLGYLAKDEQKGSDKAK